MLARTAVLLAFAVPSFAMAGCTTGSAAADEPTGPGRGGKADDPVEAADVPPELAALAASLDRPELLGQPPVADQYGADLREVQVTLVRVDAGLGAYVDARADTLLPHLGAEPAGMRRLLDAPDVHVTLTSGWEQEEIEAFLLDRIASTRSRAQVRALLDAVHGDLVHLEAYDVGAEIIGEDILLIRPLGSTVALEVHWRYVQT